MLKRILKLKWMLLLLLAMGVNAFTLPGCEVDVDDDPDGVELEVDD